MIVDERMEDDLRSTWYMHALQVIHHPVALVGVDNKFIWCNASFERLIGYSEAELAGRTWMSITHHDDVGGDLAAAESLIRGDRNTYTTAKKYIHKNGDTVPIALTVWRYPESGAMLGFSVEAIPENAMNRLDKIHDEHVAELQAIAVRVEKIERIYKALTFGGELLLKWAPLVAMVGSAIGWFVIHFMNHKQ